MSTTVTGQTHMEQILVEVTSLLLERARIQLEREVAALGAANTDQTAASALKRLHELEKELHAIRRELGLSETASSASRPGRQVSKFYEVPGQEDA